MTTPIEELTAREMEEGAKHTLGPQKGQPVQPELVPPPVVLAPQVAPLLTNPVVTHTAPIASEEDEFLKHLEQEIEEHVAP